MKCENCGNELIGGAIICRACGHNNARRAVNEWRSRKTGELDPPRITNPTGEPIIVPRKDRLPAEPEPNLLRFPATTTPPPLSKPRPAAAEPAAYPAWRDQVKEKVRLAREKRTQETPDLEPEPAPHTATRPVDPRDQNPIVESALRRIRYASYSQAATARAPQPSAIQEPATQPAALKEDAIEEMPAQRLAQGAIRRSESPTAVGNPFVMPRTTKDLAERPMTRTLTPRHSGGLPGVETRTPVAPAKPESARVSPHLEEPAVASPAPHPTTLPRIRADRQTTPRPTPQAPQEPPQTDSIETEIIEMPMMVNQWPLPEAMPTTLWVRTMAGAVDFELIATAYLPLFGAYATLNTSLGPEAFFVMVILLTALVFLYQLATLLVANRTTGMATLNLRLVNTDDDELPVTRRQKMLRAWAATIAFLCPPINLLVTRLNHPQRSLPDLISGTTIIGR